MSFVTVILEKLGMNRSSQENRMEAETENLLQGRENALSNLAESAKDFRRVSTQLKETVEKKTSDLDQILVHLISANREPEKATTLLKQMMGRPQ